MILHSMLTSGKSGVAARAVCFCVARGNPTNEEISAIKALTTSAIGQDRIANRPLAAYAHAALSVFGITPYHGTDADVNDAIIMLTSNENLAHMRSCEEYRQMFN